MTVRAAAQAQEEVRATTARMRGLQSETEDARARCAELQAQWGALEARVVEAERQRDSASVGLLRRNDELSAKCGSCRPQLPTPTPHPHPLPHARPR